MSDEKDTWEPCTSTLILGPRVGLNQSNYNYVRREISQQNETTCILQRGHKGKHKRHDNTSWTTREARTARVKIASEAMAKSFTELFSAMLPDDE